MQLIIWALSGQEATVTIRNENRLKTTDSAKQSLVKDKEQIVLLFCIVRLKVGKKKQKNNDGTTDKDLSTVVLWSALDTILVVSVMHLI